MERRLPAFSCKFCWPVILVTGLYAPVCPADKSPVGITESTRAVVINHFGVPVTVERIQDTDNRLVDDFAKTSRPCPPFCIHPISAAPDVETVGELELIAFVKTKVADESGLLVDARMADWYDSETIPGAVNIPFTVFTTDSNKRARLLQLLGANRDASGNYDFTRVPELLMFCNGPWCDQSPRAIRALLDIGYPASKLKYYRGGMQLWKLFGLTTVLPKANMVDK
jgi:rhodanese-related sulfurtransferase